jgi:hypothetical protein
MPSDESEVQEKRCCPHTQLYQRRAISAILQYTYEEIRAGNVHTHPRDKSDDSSGPLITKVDKTYREVAEKDVQNCRGEHPPQVHPHLISNPRIHPELTRDGAAEKL